MEDTVVLKQHYIYMFRVDLEDNNEDKLIEWFEKYNICNWLGKHEIGEQTGKPHYQMVIWSEHVKTNKQIVTMRKYWTDRLGKATCAIKSGKKIQSLCSYSTKDKGKVITNLPTSVLTRIPKWKNKTAEKIAFQDKLKDYIEQHDLVNKSRVAFAIQIMEFYKQEDRRPTRSNLQYLMWKYNKLNTTTLLEQWKLIPEQNYWSEEEEEEINHKV